MQGKSVAKTTLQKLSYKNSVTKNAIQMQKEISKNQYQTDSLKVDQTHSSSSILTQLVQHNST